MIGKNAGIRRARGEFILATNIDILFSSELMEFLAARRLDRDRMYRIDRHDVESEVPENGSVEEQLEYCRTHRIRINAIGETVVLDGERAPKGARPELAAGGIGFGKGWYAAEQHFGRLFRWSTSDSFLHLAMSGEPRTLVLEVEGGPGTGFGAFQLQLLDASGSVQAETQVSLRRSLVRILVPGGCDLVHLHVEGGGHSWASDPRTLDFRVMRCEWAPASTGSPAIAASPAPKRRGARLREIASGSLKLVSDVRKGRGSGRVGLPIPRAAWERLQPRVENSGISIAVSASPETAPIVSPDSQSAPALLHTNACGDFTLVHRDHWFELRGYPEFDLYSMNIDSLFCFMAHYGGATEQVLEEPMRIYHIEHGAGSGWTPEGSRLLFGRLAAKGIPWIEYSEVLQWAAQMQRFQTPIVFNREDWGLANFPLPDATIPV